MTFVISVFVLFMQFLWKWVDELVGKGLDWNVVTELFLYASLSTVPLALPMAVLLSSLMTFGNLGEHYELAALKSSGQSLMKIMRPLIIFSVAVTIGAFMFSNYLLPYTNLKMLSTLFDIRQQKPALNVKEGVFYNDIDGYSIRIRKIGNDQQTLQDIMIYDHTKQSGNISLTVAEYGKMYTTEDQQNLILELKDGSTYNDITNQQDAATNKPFMRMEFKEQVLRLDLSSFKMNRTPQDLFKENHQMLNGDQLRAYIDTMKIDLADNQERFFDALTNAYLPKTRAYWASIDTIKQPVENADVFSGFEKAERTRAYELALNNARNSKSACESKVIEIDAMEEQIRRFEIEFWRKYTFSFACLIMFFIGAPLGAIIRKGGLGMPVVVSVVFFIVFWVLSIIGEKLSKEGTLPAEYGMWLGCALYIPLGVWLTRAATADSGLFDIDNYKQSFAKLIPRLLRRTKKQLNDNAGSSAL
jgi:lipopolysaccharide export system permease protein